MRVIVRELGANMFSNLTSFPSFFPQEFPFSIFFFVKHEGEKEEEKHNGESVHYLLGYWEQKNRTYFKNFESKHV
jgi:hypothetical protein